MDMLARWQDTWQGLGCPLDASLCALHADLCARYGEPWRHYHTLEHLAECFAHWDAARALAQRPAEIEIALWFHDAIYAPRAHDNEQRSADWASAVILAQGSDVALVQRVHALVMATAHAAMPQGRDAHLLVDVDLSILGAPAERFDKYEQQIRAEYAWVAEPIYRDKRGQLLEQFLARARIYSTEYFFEQFEASARANLRASIARLRGDVVM